MSTWNSPTGALGDYTQSQSLSIALSASTTLGGTIQYVMANNTFLPSGLTINSTTGVISGIPAYVPINTIYYFQISATEIVNGVAYPNPTNFSIMITSLTWQNPAGSIGVFAENSTLAYQFTAIPSQNTNTVTYSILNGSLPIGTISSVTLSSTGLLTGSPNDVTRSTTYEYTIRAVEYNGTTQIGFKDRTFSMRIEIGIPIPVFVTPQGLLFSAYDSTWQLFQIQYLNQDPSLPIVIDVVLDSLPPGLEISSTGEIRGYPTPPVNSIGDPITITYTFTLEIYTINGRSLATYSITVVNQELQVGFVGRAPVIFNTFPPSFIIPTTDPYGPYYRSSDNIGDFLQNTDFIFKIIGHNFDVANGEDDLIYDLNGLIGNQIINFNATTGWINNLLPLINANIEPFSFTVRVYKASNPLLSSATLYLNATIIGDINTRITWITSSDLGQIANGSISDLAVLAIGGSDLVLNYRLISSTLASSNMKTIVMTQSQFSTFGDNGIYVSGSSNGEIWNSELSIISAFSLLYFNSAVYDSTSQTTIIVGYDQTNSAIIYQIPDNSVNYIPSSVSTTFSLHKIILVAGLYTAVGNHGTIISTYDPGNWPIEETSGTTFDLYNICNSGSLYVVVGDGGTILTSPDAITWTTRASNITISLNSVLFTGTRYVAVGDLGTILISTDAITWTTVAGINPIYNFTSVVMDVGVRIIACGMNGIIIQSINDGQTWTVIQNLISTSNLYDVMYDSVNTFSYYFVGDVGTVLIFNNDISSSSYNKLTSPTVTSLPPDLTLLLSGDISGRLAFESTTNVVDQYVEQTYSFTIQAYSPTYPDINSIKAFTLTTVQQYYLPYDDIYIKALTSIDDRAKLHELLYNGNIIPRELVYRSDDPYFGVSTYVKYQHMFGVPSIAANDFFQTYIDAVQINHYWRNITLGEIKTAQARDVNGEVIYEVVYSQIVDDLVNPQGVSIPKDIVWPRNINLHLNDWVTSLTNVYASDTYYHGPQLLKTYLSTVDGLTLSLNNITDLTVGMNITALVNTTVTNAPDGTPPIITSIDITYQTITVNVAQTLTTNQQLLFSQPLYDSLTPGVARTLYPNSLPNMRKQINDAIGQVNDISLMPLWMTSVQRPSNTILGLTPAWVICYTKPGFSEMIANNIATQWPYVLNQINFQLDRFEVDRSKTYNYLGLNPSGIPIWNTLPSAQPDVIGSDADSYIYFPRRTILPTQTQD